MHMDGVFLHVNGHLHLGVIASKIRPGEPVTLTHIIWVQLRLAPTPPQLLIEPSAGNQIPFTSMVLLRQDVQLPPQHNYI